MNPCTSSPPQMPRGSGSVDNSTLESHGLQLLEMAGKEDYEELRELLQSWDVADLLPHLQDEAINVDELQMIKRHHLSELLRNFRFGTRIRFEHHLERWRRWLNVPLQGVQGQGSGHCTGCRCQEVHTQSQAQSHFPGQNPADVDHPSEQEDIPKTEDPAKTIPAESLVALGQPRTMPVPFPMPIVQPPAQAVNDMIVVKHEHTMAMQPSTRLVDSGSGPGSSTGTPACKEESIAAADHEVSILGILRASGPKAQHLMERIGHNEPLDAVQRLLLIQLVCSFYEENQLHLTLQRSHLLENEILELFPQEQLHFYRTERRGKIYVRFTNMKRSKRLSSSRQELKRRRSELARPTPAGEGPGHVVNASYSGEPISSPDRSD
ncbi:uncharacterized protein LOC119550679 [Drosophila subpulchrella]|uniref:uncharacterized protein LOC119550679 n=1 Tax=Drosophila subpulchrella TaxID=1486046 RepID=UPI0018A14C93|nr:uncharacterized protein LOC119550679 [Drosophila subpulchrella]XP_037715468.1 uncharacterized protein LOC119550679 [Drosophila subpulchrella]